MTKLLALRVVVAADDDALIGDVARCLQALIKAAGSEPVTGEPDEGPRAYWLTADVLQGGGERASPVRRARRLRVAGQGELAS